MNSQEKIIKNTADIDKILGNVSSIIIYSINKKQTVLNTNNLLFEMGEELL